MFLVLFNFNYRLTDFLFFLHQFFFIPGSIFLRRLTSRALTPRRHHRTQIKPGLFCKAANSSSKRSSKNERTSGFSDALFSSFSCFAINALSLSLSSSSFASPTSFLAPLPLDSHM